MSQFYFDPDDLSKCIINIALVKNGDFYTINTTNLAGDQNSIVLDPLSEIPIPDAQAQNIAIRHLYKIEVLNAEQCNQLISMTNNNGFEIAKHTLVGLLTEHLKVAV